MSVNNKLPVKHKGVVIGFARVDPEDFAAFGHINWCLEKNGHVYTRTNGVYKTLAREIMNGAEHVKHMSHDLLDNRKRNLRACSKSESNRHTSRLPKNNTSGVLGVCWIKEKHQWRAAVSVDNVTVYLGNFANLEEATRARDQGAKKHYGEFATLNSELEKTRAKKI